MGVRRDPDAYHRRVYETVRATIVADLGLPTWDDLDEGKRGAIREENRRYQEEMDALGRDLAKDSATHDHPQQNQDQGGAL